MSIKKKAAKKIIKGIAKEFNVDKIINGTIKNMTNSIEKNVSNSINNEKAKKEKKIEYIKNYEVNDSEDIIKFLTEAKRNINSKDISDEEYKMWFLKIEEVFEKAEENINDEKALKKITSKYEDLKRDKKIKNFIWLALVLFYVSLGICIFFGSNGMFLIGLGISMLVCSGISFLYFNIDFRNISKSIKNFHIKDTTENFIILITTIFSIMIIIINGESHLFEKSSEKEAYNNYYDDSVEKFTVSIDVDFKKNMLFNKCDITLNLYDKEEYFEHGENKTITIELPKGTHKLKFSGNDDVDIIKLEIDGNTKVKYKLECLSGGIEVSQVSKSNYDNNDN